MTNDMKNNKGNYAQNPSRAREAGRKDREGQGNDSNDKARDASRKGGRNPSDRM